MSAFGFFLMIRPQLSPTLFPYTTLFRSPDCPANGLRTGRRDEPLLRGRARDRGGPPELPHHQGNAPLRLPLAVCALCLPERSEEHTSELQSPDHLVCRLLLEKKKK